MRKENPGGERIVPERAALLVVPANRPTAIERALSESVAEVVIDLEDAVAPNQKEKALQEMMRRLLREEASPERHISVRVNDPATHRGIQDLLAISQRLQQIVHSIVVPKADSIEKAYLVRGLLDSADPERSMGVQPLIESPRGVSCLDSTLEAYGERLLGTVFGPGDFMASLGVFSPVVGDSPRAPAREILSTARQLTVIASKAAGVRTIDGPDGQLGDDDGLRASAEAAAGLGMDGKWCIHPDQVPLVEEAFVPSLEELTSARELWRSYKQGLEKGQGAIQAAGVMVDRANAYSARSLIARYETTQSSRYKGDKE